MGLCWALGTCLFMVSTIHGSVLSSGYGLFMVSASIGLCWALGTCMFMVSTIHGSVLGSGGHVTDAFWIRLCQCPLDVFSLFLVCLMFCREAIRGRRCGRRGGNSRGQQQQQQQGSQRLHRRGGADLCGCLQGNLPRRRQEPVALHVSMISMVLCILLLVSNTGVFSN